MGKVRVRKVSVLLLLAAVFVFAGNSEAKMMTFGPLKADVPNGWTVEESEEQVAFTAPDSSAVLAIIVHEL